MNFENILVILKDKTILLDFDTLQTLYKQDTFDNHDGLGALSGSLDEMNYQYGIILDEKRGGIKVLQLKENTVVKQIKIQAHQSEISYLQISQNGKYLATASERGTLIRIFKTDTQELVQQLRRGLQYA